MRLFWLFIALVMIVLIPFGIWGDQLTAMFSQEGSVNWMQQFGNWAWIGGVALLISDLFLPIPGTVVMAALGYLYGPIWGGIIASLGSFLSGILAFGLCRMIGRNAAKWLLGEKDLAKGETIFKNAGGWIVAISRWLPVFPEVVACMAGLSRMKIWIFVLALACGSIPLGFTFAYIGYAGIENPTLAIGLSAGLPPILWFMAQFFMRKRIEEGRV